MLQHFSRIPVLYHLKQIKESLCVGVYTQWGSGFKVQDYGGGFATNIYGAMPESGIQATSH